MQGIISRNTELGLNWGFSVAYYLKNDISLICFCDLKDLSISQHVGLVRLRQGLREP